MGAVRAGRSASDDVSYRGHDSRSGFGEALMDIPRNWTFENTEIATGFDRHVREQLPWYDLVTGSIAHIARHYIPRGGLVYDIGAATGNIGRALQATLDERNASLISVESSREMAARYSGPGELQVMDALQVDYHPFDFAVLFLVLMFLPIDQRPRLLSSLRKSLKPGGAILVFDKCEAASGYLATVLWRLTLAGKISAHVSPQEIIAKELSLAGIQRPLRPEEITCGAVPYFQFGEFRGWIIEG